jgi:hypothetical protein
VLEHGLAADIKQFRWATPNEIADLADEVYAVRVASAMHEQQAPATREELA